MLKQAPQAQPLPFIVPPALTTRSAAAIKLAPSKASRGMIMFAAAFSYSRRGGGPRQQNDFRIVAKLKRAVVHRTVVSKRYTGLRGGGRTTTTHLRLRRRACAHFRERLSAQSQRGKHLLRAFVRFTLRSDAVFPQLCRRKARARSRDASRNARWFAGVLVIISRTVLIPAPPRGNLRVRV